MCRAWSAALSPLAAIQWPGRLMRAASAPSIGMVTSPKYAGLLEYGAELGRRLPAAPQPVHAVGARRALLPHEMVRAGLKKLETLARLDETAGPPQTAHGKVSALELSWYMRNQLLRDSDWAGMAHSLEIRVPFVDAELFRRLAPLLVGATPADQARYGGYAARQAAGADPQPRQDRLRHSGARLDPRPGGKARAACAAGRSTSTPRNGRPHESPDGCSTRPSAGAAASPSSTATSSRRSARTPTCAP